MAETKPHLRRLAAFMKACQPRELPKDPIVKAHYARIAEMDVAARSRRKTMLNLLSLLAFSGWESSSGFRMATELRRFWFEYFERLGRFGPTSLPSSFNVIEAFVRFDTKNLVFALRPELEHLLRFSTYLDWYTASSFPEEPRSLIDIMSEGVAYSYDFVLDSTEPRLSAGDSALLPAGISLIRHGDELSVLLLAGESPPSAIEELDESSPLPGKEELGPAEGLSENDRLLEGMPTYSRVLLASRFDLSNRLNDVRYLLEDRGKSYHVSTDDFEMLKFSLKGRTPADKFRELTENQVATLKRYRDLFSAAAACIFLPAFFIDRATAIVSSEFLTSLGADRKSPKVKRLRRELGDGHFRPVAIVKCLLTSSEPVELEYSITPPEMKFESSGFWKPLAAGEVGVSADGIPIVGKTWVHRTETWESTSPSDFVAKKRALVGDGHDEFIYVVRSPSHASDIYKIGRTTRTVKARTDELTGSTSTPLPFDVLASWPVEDSGLAERLIHERLTRYRLSPRREFFRLPLSEIVKAIESVLSDIHGEH